MSASALADASTVSRPRTSEELQLLLRQGVYAIVGGTGDDNSTVTFMERDIDDLLAHNTRTIHVTDTGVGFGTAVTKSRFAPDGADIGIDM